MTMPAWLVLLQVVGASSLLIYPAFMIADIMSAEGCDRIAARAVRTRRVASRRAGSV